MLSRTKRRPRGHLHEDIRPCYDLANPQAEEWGDGEGAVCHCTGRRVAAVEAGLRGDGLLDATPGTQHHRAGQDMAISEWVKLGVLDLSLVGPEQNQGSVASHPP